LRRLLLRRKPHKAVAVVVDVMQLVDAIMHLPVAVDTRPYVELWELEVGVPEHHHRRHLRDQKLKLVMEKPGKIKSKTSLSRTSLRHPLLAWWM
jgi:hypothetical protein